ncbi:MAG: hypothetical protein ABIV51_04940 [Saprospiraceae bacterium]
MSDFLRKFKGLFVTGVNPSATEQSSEASAEAPQAEHVSTASNHTVSGITPQLSEKFTNVLLEALDTNNQPGLDYLEFKQSVQSLSKMNMDDQTRFVSAFTMAHSMGATPEKLIQSAEFYVGILKEEEKRFSEVLVKQNQVQIGNRENELKQLEQLVKDKHTQLEKLQTEIAQHQEQMSKNREQMSEAAQRLEQTRQDFLASFELINGQIKQDLQNMKAYLK